MSQDCSIDYFFFHPPSSEDDIEMVNHQNSNSEIDPVNSDIPSENLNGGIIRTGTRTTRYASVLPSILTPNTC